MWVLTPHKSSRGVLVVADQEADDFAYNLDFLARRAYNSRVLSRQRACLELVLAAGIWGFGFIATVWALKDFGPFYLTAIRFSLSAFLGFVLFSAASSARKAFNWKTFWLGSLPGLLLGAMMILQTWGLKYTTASNSGFITTMYVLFVPFFERLWTRSKISASIILGAVMALIGTGFIVDFSFAASFNKGDLLTLLCAVAAAIQIVLVGRISPKIGSSFQINNFQSLWGAGLAFLVASFAEGLPQLQKISTVGWISILYLVFGSTILGFALQIRAQKVLNPSVASMIFLLESPFAAILAFIFLRERLAGMQWLGGVLILIASYGATRAPAQR